MTDAIRLDDRPPLRIEASHGWIVRRPDEIFGYYAWPSVARMDSGELVAVCSGGRAWHICPWGRTAIFRSSDEGCTWTAPEFVNNTPVDDRDAGMVSLGGDDLLLTWFSLDLRAKPQWRAMAEADIAQRMPDPARRPSWEKGLAALDDAAAKKWAGSWVRLSRDGGRAWGDFLRVPVNAPHGPARLRDGTLLYLGKAWNDGDGDATGLDAGVIGAVASSDGGQTWTARGDVPCGPGAKGLNFHEPHVVELPDGRLLGHIRSEAGDNQFPKFRIYQTLSSDRGASWRPARETGIRGSPPHLLALADGTVVCVYGFREKPFGVRARATRDAGATWGREWILRDDGPDSDLGYPASAPLPDGSIFTVYYIKGAPNEPCSIAWSRWRPPTTD